MALLFHLKFFKKTIICQKHFFRYLQTRSFARKHCPFPALSEKSMLDIILDWNPETRGTVSRIYKTRSKQIVYLPLRRPNWLGNKIWMWSSLERFGSILYTVFTPPLFVLGIASSSLKFCIVYITERDCLNYIPMLTLLASGAIWTQLQLGICFGSVHLWLHFGVTSSKPFHIFAANQLNPIQLLLFLSSQWGFNHYLGPIQLHSIYLTSSPQTYSPRLEVW